MTKTKLIHTKWFDNYCDAVDRISLLQAADEACHQVRGYRVKAMTIDGQGVWVIEIEGRDHA